jgi:hypothetical protein
MYNILHMVGGDVQYIEHFDNENHSQYCTGTVPYRPVGHVQNTINCAGTIPVQLRSWYGMTIVHVIIATG